MAKKSGDDSKAKNGFNDVIGLALLFTALILLVPSVLFMLFIERFLRADVLAKVGA